MRFLRFQADVTHSSSSEGQVSIMGLPGVSLRFKTGVVVVGPRVSGALPWPSLGGRSSDFCQAGMGLMVASTSLFSEEA